MPITFRVIIGVMSMPFNKEGSMKEPAFYCQRAKIVKAIRYDKTNLEAVLAFTGKHPNWSNWFKSFEDYKRHVNADGGRFKIFGPGSIEQIAVLGDYIIKDNTGLIYVLNPTTFQLLYAVI